MSNFSVLSTASTIPGYGEEGASYGSLISTDELLFRMGADGKECVACSFIREKLGVGSIAMTHTTERLCRTLWCSSSPDASYAYQLSQATFNVEIPQMLREAVKKVTASHDAREILLHYHIAAAMAPSTMFRLREALVESGCRPSLKSVILPEGCSGLLSAFSLADRMLPAKEGLAIVTAESDMSLYCHQRTRQRLALDNIDDWLWGALFGEGVGAIIIGRIPHSTHARAVLQLTEEVAETEWRVCLKQDSGSNTTRMKINAKAVKRTYLEHVTRNASEVIAAAGGMDRLSHLCLHESNPKLVQRVATDLGVPMDRCPSISHQTGSLAGVSIFALLDNALNSPTDRTKTPYIGAAVIGEAGGVIRSGRFFLQ
jgi:3-oxoacyl-[acyl-carrier-protein] synthase III